MEIGIFERFTESARKAINKAYSIARENNNSEFKIIHIFLALLEDEKGFVNDILSKLGVDIEKTAKGIRDNLALLKSDKINDKVNFTPVFSEEVKNLLNESYLISAELSSVYVGSEHVLLAMFRTEGLGFIEDMKKVGINFQMLKETVTTMNTALLGTPNPNDPMYKGESISDAAGFYRDMNELSMQGKYPNISGRDKEIQRLIHILSRKTKNNPILVGDAGVGKTAIVEGLANKIVDKDIPASLMNKRILSVDVAAIVAGAKLRGDVEERINFIINKAIEDGNVILFIDEIHNIIGAGSVGGKDSMDIANIMKPYLTTSELVVIGATTADEYSKYFEADSALSRRFQPISVDELDIESATKVLFNIKKDFETFHKVKIADEAVEQAVKLSDQFIKDRYLPDKAIDILDEASASIKIGREVAIEPELSELGERLLKVQSQKEDALLKKNMDKASIFKTKEDEIINEIEKVVEGKKGVKTKYSKIVTTDLVKQIIYDWTKIPLVASDISNKTLRDLEEKLIDKIVGQNHVVENVSLAIKRSHLGLGNPNRPLASFLFLGPTGVGKTELAKTLAKELFGSEDLLFQLDMSEYMEMHSVSKLIGSPPGYVGYQEGGQLTKHVKRKPYSVVLFDEIEKAHPDTLNLLLQILEEGQLTDGKGVKVNFNNCIIVMTSNIGAHEVSTDNKLGFDITIRADNKEELDQAFTEMKEKILERLKHTLRPELLNRIDTIDVFRGLNKEDSLKITRINVDELKLRLLEKGVMLSVSDAVISKVNEEGYSKEYGGRNIRRKVQEMIENNMAQFFINQKLPVKRKSLVKVNAEVVNEKIEFTIN
jgi:ATP-dependent Clp protease ATP-binding subunit ClpC